MLLTLKFQTDGFQLELMEHFVTFIRIKYASNYRHFWTYV